MLRLPYSLTRWTRSASVGVLSSKYTSHIDRTPVYCPVQRHISAAARNMPARVKVKGRPSLDDVERLARGQAANKRGTGSRGVPHRLNAEELAAFQNAKNKRYLTVKGSGQRRARRLGNNSPVVNTFRQLCDVYAWPAVLLEQGTGTDKPDVVLVDTSPTRLKDQTQLMADIVECASQLGCSVLQDPGPRPDQLPAHLRLEDGDFLCQPSIEMPVLPGPKEFEEAEAKIRKQGDVVRELKASGMSNGSELVQKEVAKLLDMKQVVQEYNEQIESVQAREDELVEIEEKNELLRLDGAIWQLQTKVVRFHCPDGRPQAQALCLALAKQFCVTQSKKAAKGRE